VPFVAPPGIRWVRVDRASGKPVFGIFPTTEDPKSQVIWEAFQPQTEQQRTFRSAIGDPYNEAQRQQALQAWQQAQLQQQQQEQQQQPPRGPTPGSQPPPAQQPTTGLPTQNTF
jgi:penicillin-binding protein 1A